MNLAINFRRRSDDDTPRDSACDEKCQETLRTPGLAEESKPSRLNNSRVSEGSRPVLQKASKVSLWSQQVMLESQSLQETRF